MQGRSYGKILCSFSVYRETSKNKKLITIDLVTAIKNHTHTYVTLDASKEYGLEINGVKKNRQYINVSSAQCKDLLATCFHAGILLGLFLDPEDGGEMLLDFQRTTWRYITDDSTLHNHGCGSLKAYKCSLNSKHAYNDSARIFSLPISKKTKIG
jgi:hypothetical protein